MISQITEVHLFIKIQPNISEQEKKRQSLNDFLNAETKLKFLRQPYIKQIIIFMEKDRFKEKLDLKFFFFSLFNPVFEKNAINLNFHD